MGPGKHGGPVNIHMLILEGPLEVTLTRRRLKNGMDGKSQRMDGNEIRYLVRLAQDREQWKITTTNLLEEDST